MMTIALRHPETYDRVTAFLRSLLPAPDLDWQSYASYEAIEEAVDDPQVWTTAVARLCDLRDPKAYDLIGQLFQAGLIDEMAIDPTSYQEAYRRRGPPASFSEKPESLVDRYERSQPRRKPRSTRGTRIPSQRSKQRGRRRRR